jgi:hypothetical protein
VTVDGLTPTVTIHSSAASINSNQTVTIYGAVSGTDGTPTGTVTLTGGGYSSSQTLSSGSYSFTIPYNTFTSTETVTLTVTYNGNSIYDSANNQTNVGVTYVQPLTPTVTVTPTPNTLDSSQSLSVKVAVSGSSSQETYPSGTVMLAATVTGSSTVLYSLTETLASGSYTFTIPADTFKASESITLTATYNGDADYYSNTGTSSVTVTHSDNHRPRCVCNSDNYGEFEHIVFGNRDAQLRADLSNQPDRSAQLLDHERLNRGYERGRSNPRNINR